MAFRGRGRGGFGGFRGIQRHDIQLADDEKVSDVPSNFPACESMPKRFEDDGSPEMIRLMKRLNLLRMAYTKSAFHIPRAQRTEQEGSAPDVRRRIEVPAPAVKSKTAPALSQVVFMHSKYLPEELYSAKDQKQSMQKRSAAFFMAHGHLQEASFESRMKALAEEDAKARVKGEDADDDAPQKDQGKKGGDDDDDGAPPQEEDDDELDHEDDDYYQGENFDDDEEYGDDDDGGNDEPYF